MFLFLLLFPSCWMSVPLLRETSYLNYARISYSIPTEIMEGAGEPTESLWFIWENFKEKITEKLPIGINSAQKLQSVKPHECNSTWAENILRRRLPLNSQSSWRSCVCAHPVPRSEFLPSSLCHKQSWVFAPEPLSLQSCSYIKALQSPA